MLSIKTRGSVGGGAFALLVGVLSSCALAKDKEIADAVPKSQDNCPKGEMYNAALQVCLYGIGDPSKLAKKSDIDRLERKLNWVISCVSTLDLRERCDATQSLAGTCDAARVAPLCGEPPK